MTPLQSPRHWLRSACWGQLATRTSPTWAWLVRTLFPEEAKVIRAANKAASIMKYGRGRGRKHVQESTSAMTGEEALSESGHIHQTHVLERRHRQKKGFAPTSVMQDTRPQI